jgi:hypothetical protein
LIGADSFVTDSTLALPISLPVVDTGGVEWELISAILLLRVRFIIPNVHVVIAAANKILRIKTGLPTPVLAI